MKTLCILLISFFLLNFNLTAQESLLIETETRYWDKTNAYNGYTLFA
jgi:hypothetical protein